eukprot:scaffold2856_cov47-Attheya_sp.AAC.4
MVFLCGSNSIDKDTKEHMEVASIVQNAMDVPSGWDSCKTHIAEDAAFECQAGALNDLKTVQAYVEWCEGFGKICPDSTFTTHMQVWDDQTSTVVFLGTYHAKHTGEGGPVEATQKSTDSEYVYFFKFNEENKIVHVRKVWNDGFALKELGWA